jgi:protein-L-isoaspartate(D-aspartate) O-methyltransferase
LADIHCELERAGMKERPSFPAKLQSSVAPVSKQPISSKTWTASLQAQAKSPLQSTAASGFGLDSETVRAAMVRKLMEQGVEDEMVLNALGSVERHKFIDSALANQAYEDTSLPIGFGQTISKPNVVARMIELLRQGNNLKITGKLGRVLEIGTGCGYQAALLSKVSQEVYSIERIKGLYENAKENLRPMRIPNLHLILGDGMLGCPAGAPFAGIIAAAGGDAIPQAWIDQLAEGGRIVAPLAGAQGVQSLVVIDKRSSGLHQTLLEPVHFVPLKSGVI